MKRERRLAGQWRVARVEEAEYPLRFHARQPGGVAERLAGGEQAEELVGAAA